MAQRKIQLVTIKDLMNFVRTASTISGDVYLSTESGNIVVDAKSLLGVMSLNLLRPVIVSYPSNETYFTDFLHEFTYREES